ncbi:MAG: glycine-rich protein [bacterium]|nr:glycine-rich protein [bacterium]
MKRTLLKITLGLSLITIGQNANGQCPTFNCLNDTIVSTAPSSCDAIVTFTTPTATDTCNPGGFQTFNYTGAMQTWVVPNGITSINVDAYGAQGGSNSPQTNVNYGGRVQADLPVTPGTTIYIYVGEQPNGLTGGWNGGGNGETGGQGGGGASDIRIGGTTLNDRVIVAGGAGGGGFWSGQEVHGGIGGGLTAGPGYRDNLSNYGGDPGTQTSSGVGTCQSFNNPVVAGGFGFGGAPSSCGCEGYGGGGGWWGGAGSGNCRGGGGGSSYTDPSATNVIHTQGVKVGHGSITISWGSGTPTITQIAGLASGSTFPVGSVTQTFIAESGGAVDTCSFVITVVDGEAPTVSCPGNTIEVCEGTPVSVAAPATADNCTSTPTVTYNTTGATSVSGNDSITGVLFNPGTTTVWYMATDAAGNVDSCSFDVIVNPAPAVSLDPFSVDSLCNYSDPIGLPTGTPASGTYSGTGVSGMNFDPSASGNGTFFVTYSYTDSLGCTGMDSTAIIVHGCAETNDLNSFADLNVYPNPSNGVFNIEVSGQTGQATYVLTTVDGRFVAKNEFAMEDVLTIDLSNEPKGFYVLQLQSAQTTKSITLIKE